MRNFFSRRALLLATAICFLTAAHGLAATFNGTNTGGIPDGQTGTPPQYGSARNVLFTVSGMSGPLTEVSLNVTMSHTFIGDVDMVLVAPNGGSAQVFGHIGVTASGSSGDSSNFAGTYNFTDTAAGPNIWTVATNGACGDTCTVTQGNYRATARGINMQTNPPPVVNLTAMFAGVTNPNGVWILRVRDGSSTNTGTILAAILTLGGTQIPVKPSMDFNGDGESDWAVARNTGGGGGGQLTWYIAHHGAGTGQVSPFGVASDALVPGDYDGDNRTDIAIWRPATGDYYILQSAGGTVRFENFGQNGDDPAIVADYDGDNKDDLAVYRNGASPGSASTFYYRTTPGGPVNGVQWGLSGDLPAAGDYDGDGRGDFVVQRSGGGGTAQATFWLLYANGATGVVPFGQSNDRLVPGDYDGDGKTDIATSRTVGSGMRWYYRPSTGGPAYVEMAWGLATDLRAQADYDGDGKTDPAVWRPGGVGRFYAVTSSTGGSEQFIYGANGDLPVAAFNNH